MTDDEEHPVSGLDMLDAPTPGPNFWPDLHARLVDELDTPAPPDFEATDVPIRLATVQPVDLVTATSRARFARGLSRPTRGLLAALSVAAVALAALAGAAVVNREDHSSMRETYAEPGSVLTDPDAISLDEWATAPPRRAPGSFAIFDLTALPAGWEVTSPAVGGGHVNPDVELTRYRWSAGITADGHQLWLTAASPMSIGTESATVVAVNGEMASLRDGTLSWFDRSGVGLRITSGDDLTPEELVALAEQIPVVTADRVDTPDAPTNDGRAVSGVVRLAGTIAGQRWEVVSAEDASTDLSLVVDGATRSTAAGAPRALVNSWDVNVTGLGNDGTMIFGLAQDGIVSVRVTLNTATVDLPIAHDDRHHVVYAVPIPPGLNPWTIQLIGENGDTLNTVAVPPFLVPSLGTAVHQDQPLDELIDGPDGFPASNRSVSWHAPQAELEAASLVVVAGQQRFAPPADAGLDGGASLSTPTLEAAWINGAVEMRVNLYFATDGTDWWVSEVRVYNGDTEGDWITTTGELFRTPLGEPFTGDIDLTLTNDESGEGRTARLVATDVDLRALIDRGPGDTIPPTTPPATPIAGTEAVTTQD